ncbi:peptide chain release factor N(5)-glutamine methyltransferase [Ornithinimicrobium cryptoxanthini]|uniref:Release factor glutamine methyltransferase n=1 Tax=Ornithinimicrobium cryptoxanthini TaxID=2934161 RepID=A0ABY4YGF1_9MICO|nr:peptide chain release factor N(5)-glutamine methyltransferase [Ornithinimicrobium cryptoxanthini]USQ75707.1 peptide chain release factor N(5)-glutamine methyltransferase [Ornithinimicrobium cryptoxanthini]
MNPSTGAGRAGDLVRAAARELQAAGVASPRRDAEALLGHVLDRDQAELSRALLMGESVGEGERAAYDRLVAERAARVPLQHLTGQAHFRHLTLRVGPGVFVPRPETEVLVDLALTDLRERGRDRPVVVDLCTGSGAIALALAHEWPAAQVHAVELSEDAHAWAAANVERSGLALDLRLGDATVAFDDLVGAVDVVVSNPPYIPPGSVPVDPEVRDHDPEIALYGGGDDGLSVPLAVAQRAADLLVAGGVLVMEHADVQGEALVRALTAARVWSHVADHLDLTGLPRVTRAVRAPRS